MLYPQSSAMIEAINIAKYYGAHAAVDGLNLSVSGGEVVGLLGLNGAGKTTTLRILSGLLVPTHGEVYLGGINLGQEPERARSQIGFLPETPPLYPDMRVRAYLTFAARIRGVTGKIKDEVDGALAITDLEAVQNARIGTLSHGYHRRVGIAQTLVHRPKVILLDEPTSGLDPVQVVHMRRLILSLRGRATILISSHVLTEIQALCDRIVVLNEGRVIAQGTEAELALSKHPAPQVLVEVHGSQEILEGVLRKLPFVHSTSAPQVTALGVRCVVQLDTDARALLCQALVEAGLGVLTLAHQPVALETTFLRLMGQQDGGTQGVPGGATQRPL